MTATDQLTDEEKEILIFLESYFEQHGARHSLAMLRNVDTKADDLRTIIEGYRWLYQSER
jgi:hypothetical protein